MNGIILAAITFTVFSAGVVADGKEPGSMRSPDENGKYTAERTDTSANRSNAGKRMRYRGFLGGMMLHTGYVCSNDLTITSLSGTNTKLKVGGAPFGIGGAIRFMFGKHLRIGAEGYVSTLKYGRHGNSHAETGWGGILADCVWDCGKCNIFIGGTAGGGSQTNTTILSEIKDDYVAEQDISYRKYNFIAIAPFAGIEYAISRKINIVLKADWLLNVSNPQDDFVTGPRLYIGFMFGHAH